MSGLRSSLPRFRTWMLLPLLGLLCGAAPAPLPGLDGTERRVAVDVRDPPWFSLVRINVPGSARCTGVLVSPQEVAMAAHCLFIRRAGHFAPPGSVHVLRGYAAGSYAAHEVAVGYRVAPGFDATAPGRSQGADVAVLRLAVPLGPALPLDAGVVGRRIVLGGYGQDRMERLVADLDCTITGIAQDPAGRALLVHGCAATFGESGSPLLARDDAGWRVLGIAVAGFGGRPGGLAVPADALRPLLGQH